MAHVGERKFVVFLDSLGYDDVEQHTDWIAENAYDGVLDAGNPYVTPRVLGSIYTGENPGFHGLPSVSRYGQEGRTRPAAPTLPEIAAESPKCENVVNLGLPFIIPPKVDPTDLYWHYSTAMGQSATLPTEAQAQMFVPGPAGDLSDPDEDGSGLFNNRVDFVRSTFNTARTIAQAQDIEVMFISCRNLDEYCHYRYDKPDDGLLTDRQTLLSRVIDEELESLAMLGDVFVFGDHGATDMTGVFKINRWLMDNGYLDVTIDEDYIQKAIRYGQMDEPDEPGVVRMLGWPGVEIDEEASVAVSDDPFSGGITLLDGATDRRVEEMIADLIETEHVDRVDWTRDMWSGDLIHEAPDLYPYRNVGSFISGNLAEEMGGPEITRSGVHHPWGAFGATTELDVPDEHVPPEALFDFILTDFLGIDPPPANPTRNYGATTSEDDEAAVKDRLRDLGYL